MFSLVWRKLQEVRTKSDRETGIKLLLMIDWMKSQMIHLVLSDMSAVVEYLSNHFDLLRGDIVVDEVCDTSILPGIIQKNVYFES
jgi:hypothetical protein